MQLAQECLKEQAEEPSDVPQPLEGLEMFAQTIETGEFPGRVRRKHLVGELFSDTDYRMSMCQGCLVVLRMFALFCTPELPGAQKRPSLEGSFLLSLPWSIDEPQSCLNSVNPSC